MLKSFNIMKINTCLYGGRLKKINEESISEYKYLNTKNVVYYGIDLTDLFREN